MTDPLIGTTIGGYVVIARIGGGGMGTVYRGEQAAIGARVAIKVLAAELARDPAILERFAAEARHANAVRHDGLLDVLAAGALPDGRPYLVMELLDGASLDVHLRARPPLGTLCGLVCDALAALARAHAAGLVHRDLKPSNLFVTTSGRVVVIDFGLARLADGPALTRTGQVFGTPAYMAPEHLAGEVVDGRADLYALGVVLQGCIVASGTGAPAALDAVIQTATAQDRARRFPDAAAMIRQLRAAMTEIAADAFGPLSAAVTDTVESADATQVSTAGPVARGGHEVGGTLGRYEILAVIGRGGAGTVLLGFDATVKRRVALKVLRDTGGTRRVRLLDEARAMAKVVHPNVATLYELGTDGDDLFLAMELVDGSTLGAWVRDKPRPWRELVGVFLAAGDGLAAAHAVGVVHRDFKPENVLVGADARPRVTDFGIALEHGEEGYASGTPAYMAPEQVDGELADPRADQYAFCVSLWQALHGELPFAGDDAHAIAASARRGELRPRANALVPAALDVVLRRGLSAQPAARYDTMREMLDAIRAAVAPRRRWWLAAPATALVVGAIAVAVAVTRSTAPSEAPVGSGPPAPTPAEIAEADRDALADAHRATDPAVALRALARVSDGGLADPAVRWFATDLARSGPIRTFDEDQAVDSAAMSADHRWVAVALDRAVSLHALGAGATDRTVLLPEQPRALSFASDAVVVYYASGAVAAIPLDGGRPRELVRCTPASGDRALGPAQAPRSELRAMTCPQDDGVDLVDLTARPPRITDRPTRFSGFSRDGRRLLQPGPEATTLVEDVASGTIIGRFASGDPATVDGDVAVAVRNRELQITRFDHPATTSVPLELDVDFVLATPRRAFAANRAAGRIDAWTLDGAHVLAWNTKQPVVALVVADANGDRVLAVTDTHLELRDFATGRAFTTPFDADSALTLAPDGTAVVMWRDKRVSVWFPDLQPPRVFDVPVSAAEHHLTLSDDARRIAYVRGGTTVVRDVASGQELEAFADATEPRFTPDGRMLVGIAADHQVWSWDGSPAQPLPGRRLGVMPGAQAVSSLDGEHVFASAGKLEMLAGGELTTPCGDLPISWLTNRVAILDDHGHGVACDVTTGARTPVDPAFASSVTQPAVSADGTRVATVTDDTVSVFRVADGTREWAQPVVGQPVVAIDARGDVVTASARDASILLVRGVGVRLVGGAAGQFTPSRDGRHVLGVVDHAVIAWDVDHPDTPHVLAQLGTSVTAGFAADGDRALVIAGADGAQAWAVSWSLEPATVAEIRGWIQTVTGR